MTGAIPAGTVLTATIDGVAVHHVVGGADIASSIAANVAAAINGATAVEAARGQPLNQVVSATASGNMVTVTAKTWNAPFTLVTHMTEPATA